MTINLENYPRGVSSHVIGPTSRMRDFPEKQGKSQQQGTNLNLYNRKQLSRTSIHVQCFPFIFVHFYVETQDYVSLAYEIFGTSNFGVYQFSVVVATSRYVDQVF